MTKQANFFNIAGNEATSRPAAKKKSYGCRATAPWDQIARRPPISHQAHSADRMFKKYPETIAKNEGLTELNRFYCLATRRSLWRRRVSKKTCVKGVGKLLFSQRMGTGLPSQLKLRVFYPFVVKKNGFKTVQDNFRHATKNARESCAPCFFPLVIHRQFFEGFSCPVQQCQLLLQQPSQPHSRKKAAVPT